MSDSEVYPTLLDAIHESDEWFKSLDRSVIGALAIEEELLIAIQARERYRFNGGKEMSNSFSSFPSALFSSLSSNISHKISAKESRATYSAYTVYRLEDYLRYCAEVFFWWMQTEPDKIGYIRERAYNEPYLDESLSRLLHILNEPSTLPFYEAGIEDEELVSSFIDSGMDASIAQSLLG